MHYAFLELEKYDNIEEDAFYDYFNVNPVQILQKSYEQSSRDAKREVKEKKKPFFLLFLLAFWMFFIFTEKQRNKKINPVTAFAIGINRVINSLFSDPEG